MRTDIRPGTTLNAFAGLLLVLAAYPGPVLAGLAVVALGCSFGAWVINQMYEENRRRAIAALEWLEWVSGRREEEP